MKSLLRIAIILMGLAGIMRSSTASTDRLSPADTIAIHHVVQSQLEALADDDAVMAFALTSSAKREQIGTPDNFLQLIKTYYQPIYRHLGVIFSQPEIVDGNAIQVVRITDPDNHVWIAIFWMEHGDNNDWKIDGCQLLETSTVSI